MIGESLNDLMEIGKKYENNDKAFLTFIGRAKEVMEEARQGSFRVVSADDNRLTFRYLGRLYFFCHEYIKDGVTAICLYSVDHLQPAAIPARIKSFNITPRGLFVILDGSTTKQKKPDDDCEFIINSFLLELVIPPE